jgi:hypothetical protein
MQRNTIQLVGRALMTILVAALIASGPNVVFRNATAEGANAVSRTAPTIDFNQQIRPILSDKCFRCHGPDTAQRKAGLRLDRAESALHELDSGVTAIVPRDPSRSEMIRRIFSDDPEERMPPQNSQKSLTDTEKALLRAWVADGAEYSKHWSFVRPKRPAPPILPVDKWSTNDIDRFIFQRLRQEKLAPSAETDRRTLIRRVSFDLNGLPPAISEVDAFLADNQPGAYDRVVDRLLASPRFGERMAMHWLDLARYADTDGYEKDGHRQMWPYRDWVIRAFNNNLPFDEFTIEQLAGDMLPSPTRDQLIATAFNRNNPTTSEAGSDPDEFAAKYAIDRLNTTANVWLGLTTQCAECHDHKFDPITTDFYRLFAFFNQMPEVPLYEGPDAPPSIMVATPEQEKKLSDLASQIAAAKADLEKDPKGTASAAQRERIASLEKQVADLRALIPKVRVMQPASQQRPTHILIRGDYLNPGKEVTAGIPAVFGQRPNENTSRLALARWIVSGENPLTARVVVNRLWAMCFGTGLVSTMNDFGAQGELPTHPELLDWLATEFVARHWDVKAMLRLIVTSSAYRQSSRATPELLERDPGNRLLTRGPRFRLPAEMIRDNALAVSGLLHEQLGGPSNFSYHPAGLWEEMAWADSPWKTWPQQHDTNLYRRGLYTFWKRSMLHPVMSLFDAPSRNVCEVGRSTTNTPLQAYVTLNEASFVEAARFLAARMMGNGGDSPENAIEDGYLRATLRPPSDNERKILRNLYDRMYRHFNERPVEAEAFLAVGESSSPKELDHVKLAAWTTVAQVILNLDETITKE